MEEGVSLQFTCPGCGKDVIPTKLVVIDGLRLAVLVLCSHCVEINTVLCPLEYLTALSQALSVKKAAEEARKKIEQITDPKNEEFDLANFWPSGRIQ